MRARLHAILTAASLTIASSNVTSAQSAQRPAPECHEWQECQQLALDARARGQYERFHDLAWRTVQTGPQNDPALMYLLARAQSLSGRPRDALIMLRRLVNRGIVTDAATDQDLDGARRLDGWPDLETLMNRVASAAAVPAVVPSTPPLPARTVATGSATPPPVVRTPSVVRNALRFEPRPAEEVSRFSTEPFVASGLAYDAVSGRFLFGDAAGRRVIVVGEQSSTAVDLVRAASGHFYDVTAFAIDPKRGDLWMASTAPDGGAGAVHKLQLISGRPIALIESPRAFQVVKLIDLAIATNGSLLVLDAAAPRVIRLRSAATTLEELMPLDVAAPASIAAAGDEETAYVAHRDGIARLDLQRRSAVPVTAPASITLGGFERIRWHRNALIGVQVLPDGSRQVVRLQLIRGRAVTEATVIGESLSREAGPTFATVANDDVYYLVTGQRESSTTPGATVMDVVVKRIRLP